MSSSSSPNTRNSIPAVRSVKSPWRPRAVREGAADRSSAVADQCAHPRSRGTTFRRVMSARRGAEPDQQRPSELGHWAGLQLTGQLAHEPARHHRSLSRRVTIEPAGKRLRGGRTASRSASLRRPGSLAASRRRMDSARRARSSRGGSIAGIVRWEVRRVCTRATFAVVFPDRDLPCGRVQAARTGPSRSASPSIGPGDGRDGSGECRGRPDPSLTTVMRITRAADVPARGGAGPSRP
jgi:hypothetical protein